MNLNPGSVEKLQSSFFSLSSEYKINGVDTPSINFRYEMIMSELAKFMQDDFNGNQISPRRKSQILAWATSFESAYLYNSVSIPIRFKSDIQRETTINDVIRHVKDYVNQNAKLVKTSWNKCEINGEYYVTMHIAYNLFKNQDDKFITTLDGKKIIVKDVSTNSIEHKTLIEMIRGLDAIQQYSKIEVDIDRREAVYQHNDNNCISDVFSASIFCAMQNHKISENNSDSFIADIEFQDMIDIVNKSIQQHRIIM